MSRGLGGLVIKGMGSRDGGINLVKQDSGPHCGGQKYFGYNIF